jgi:hypothetical protein
VDAKGRLCRADGNLPVQFELSGPSTSLGAGGAIAGVDNGDPTNHEPFKGPDATHAGHMTFHGLEIVVLRAPRAAGTMTITARSTSLLYDTATAVELVQQTEKMLDGAMTAKLVPAIPAAAGASRLSAN